VDVIAGLLGLGEISGTTAAGPVPFVYRAGTLTLGYLLFALAFTVFGLYAAKHPESETEAHEMSGH
jgi:hypothetical protein